MIKGGEMSNNDQIESIRNNAKIGGEIFVQIGVNDIKGPFTVSSIGKAMLWVKEIPKGYFILTEVFLTKEDAIKSQINELKSRIRNDNLKLIQLMESS